MQDVNLFFYFSKTLEYNGFKALLNQIAESKKVPADAVFAKVNSSSGPSTAGTTVIIIRYFINK